VRWSGQAGHLADWRDDDMASQTSDARRATDGSSAPGQAQPTGQRDMTTANDANDANDSGQPPAARGVDDLSAFCALLDAYAATLTRVAAALVGASDAEDAAQEAVVRAWRAWPELRDRSAARAWLTSITINVCRDWLRGRFGARRRLTESLWETGDEPRAIALLDADPGASDHAAALDLRHALTTLDDDLRIIVALRYYSGLDSTTIGAALGMPAATVRTRLRRALGLLRDQLSGAQAPDPATQTTTETSNQTSNQTEGRR
jgi:RNA polymerase sigma-70 factor (ECF subfamily)